YAQAIDDGAVAAAEVAHFAGVLLQAHLAVKTRYRRVIQTQIAVLMGADDDTFTSEVEDLAGGAGGEQLEAQAADGRCSHTPVVHLRRQSIRRQHRSTVTRRRDLPE